MAAPALIGCGGPSAASGVACTTPWSRRIWGEFPDAGRVPWNS
jgi:hypothetical protein